jgi:hypothetical protein
VQHPTFFTSMLEMSLQWSKRAAHLDTSILICRRRRTECCVRLVEMFGHRHEISCESRDRPLRSGPTPDACSQRRRERSNQQSEGMPGTRGPRGTQREMRTALKTQQNHSGGFTLTSFSFAPWLAAVHRFVSHLASSRSHRTSFYPLSSFLSIPSFESH